MVGVFSRFSSTNKTGHRTTLSALLAVDDEREVLSSNPGVARDDVVASGIAHGIEAAVEFKPVEHPFEPLDIDRPVQCPQPEPSILNDGRIWKERISAANVRTRADLPLIKEGSGSAGDSAGPRSEAGQSSQSISPSLSAPENNILKLLDESQTTAS